MGAAVLVLLTGAAAASGAARSARSPRTGFVLSIASPAASTPTWAYPFASGDVLTPANVDDFQQLLYRPLYSFAGSPTVQFNAALSLATAPTYRDSDTVVSFTIKPGLQWSDGQPVTADGVVEWLNLLASFPGAWGDYLPPLDGTAAGLPDDLREVSVTGPTVTLTLDAPVNPTWFTYSELSQLTVLPASWDRYEPTRPHVPMAGPLSIAANHGDYTAPTADAGCYAARWVGDGNHGPTGTFLDPLGTRTVVPAAEVGQAQRCDDVVELMRSMSADTADYTTRGTSVAAAFGLSDGPWRLSSYDRRSGAITMVANLAKGASGTRPAATLLRFVPCATTAACTALLTDGRVDQGTLPIADAPRVASLAAASARNPVHGYRETVVAPWATSYLPYDFGSRLGADGRAGRVLAQRYVREALQSLVDQATMVRTVLGGYGVVTDAPVPVLPSTGFATAVADPTPFGLSRAAALLAANGWHVAPGATTTCALPARCGPGIPKGTPLHLTVEYPATDSTLAAELALFRLDAGRVGVTITLDAVGLDQVLSDVSSTGGWDLASWGGGWQFAPGYFPSGEWTFAQGSPWNVGDYADARATSLVEATLRAPDELAAYDRYVAQQLPVLWMPTAVSLVETRASLRGVVVSPLGSITPESWRP